MNKETIIFWLQFLFSGILVCGGGFALSAYLKKAAAVQKNEHIKSALELMSQAVLYAQNFMVPGLEKQKISIADGRKRLGDNNLLKYFTDDQILKMANAEYARNKAAGNLDAITPSKELPKQ